VTFVDDSFRTVSVEKVDCKEEGSRKKSERGVSLDKEVKEVWPHEPLDFGLNVD
jgi:hypothetical protein